VSTLAAVASLALAHAGLTGLALAMERHHRQLRPAALPGRGTRATFRAAGWALLALSHWMSLAAWGAATGTAAWFGVLSTAALALVLMLPYAPMLAWRTGWIAGIAGLLVLAMELARA